MVGQVVRLGTGYHRLNVASTGEVCPIPC